MFAHERTDVHGQHSWSLLTLAALAALIAVAAVPRSAAASDEPAAPAAVVGEPHSPGPLDADFADPFVMRDGETYYAFATGAQGRNVQVARSRDLARWAMLPDALPNLPAWAARVGAEGRLLTWAPSVLRRPRGYVLYYTAADTGSGFQCISRATATRAEGPYVDDSDRPFVCQVAGPTPRCGSIDPSPFVDANGRAWLLWKSDENSAACRTTARLWSQPLSEDGLSVTGSAAALIETDRAWEGPLVEGPSMLRDGDGYLLFYSANWYESADYAIGYARCDSPSGPCRKMSIDAPLIRSSKTALGPGGQELFTDGVGRAWMAYHAWSPPQTTYAGGGSRSLRLARLTIANGVPALVGTTTPEPPTPPERAAVTP